MYLQISPNDSALLQLAKVKSYLLYPGKNDGATREKVWLSFYLESLRKNTKEKKALEYLTPNRLFLLNDSPPISYLKKRFEERQDQIFTCDVLMRLLTSGEKFKKSQMSLRLALNIYANRYAVQGGNPHGRPSNISSAKNHWNVFKGAKHLAAAWQRYNPIKSKNKKDGPLSQRMLKYFAISEKFYDSNKKQVNSWRDTSLFTKDNTWLVPKDFVLPEVTDRDLRLLSRKDFDQYCEQYSKAK